MLIFDIARPPSQQGQLLGLPHYLRHGSGGDPVTFGLHAFAAFGKFNANDLAKGQRPSICLDKSRVDTCAAHHFKAGLTLEIDAAPLLKTLVKLRSGIAKAGGLLRHDESAIVGKLRSDIDNVKLEVLTAITRAIPAASPSRTAGSLWRNHTGLDQARASRRHRH